MPESIHPLIVDLVEWVAREPRSYAEVMEAWRTSCPRLTIWEDAVDRGYLVCERSAGGVHARVTPAGRELLAEKGRLSASSAVGAQRAEPDAAEPVTRQRSAAELG